MQHSSLGKVWKHTVVHINTKPCYASTYREAKPRSPSQRMHAHAHARTHTHTHLVSGDKDPSEDAPWCALCDNLVSGLSSLSYAIIFHSWRLFLAFLTFFTSRVVPSIRFCSWRPRRKASVPRQREGKEQVSAVATAAVSLGCRQGGPLSITPGSRTS